MGVKNWDFIPWKWAGIDEIIPSKLAIDTPNYLTRRLQAFEYGAKLSIERIPTSHLTLTLGIIRSCLSSRLLPIFVFDGPPENLKRDTNPELVKAAADLYSQYNASQDIYDSKIAEQLINSRALRWYFSVNHIKDLCSALGIPAVTAPSEAEMMAAVMCKEGLVGSVLTNDADSLLFGSPHVTRTIQFSKGVIESCTLNDLQEVVKLEVEQLRDLAIVCGCDFHKEGVKGIGPRKGVVLLERHGGLEGLLKSKSYPTSEIEEFLLAREVFDEPNYISLNGVSVALGAPVVSQVIDILNPVLGYENAEQQSRRFVQLWKNFGKEQTTLEQWV
jgi:flap endonuclease-1